MHEATDLFRREHRNISLVVHMAQEILTKRQTNPDIGIRDLPEMTNFFLRYADHLHHAKEEAVLFTAMRRDQQSASLLDELMAEHQQIRSILNALEQSLEQGRRDLYFENIRTYISRIKMHIEKENHKLFTRADEIFSSEEQHHLAEQLLEVQSERMLETERKKWDEYAGTGLSQG